MNQTSDTLDKGFRSEPGATARKYAFLPSLNLILIQALIAQNDEFK